MSAQHAPKAASLLEALVLEVQASAKYRHVSPDLIRRVGAREIAASRGLKEAVKATKNTLHQIAGAFLDAKPRYEIWQQQLQQAIALPTEMPASASLGLPASELRFPDGLRHACLDIMGHHASTRERLPLLGSFYAQTLAAIQPVRSVLDLCCGLNPLALSWMPLAPDATYYACDIFADMMAFLNAFFALADMSGQAAVCDAGSAVPTQAVHLVLLLKALPPLEQTDKRAGLRLLRELQAEHILVSFPTRTLGGRSKNMGAHYEVSFRALVADEDWHLERFEFANELCFLVSK